MLLSGQVLLFSLTLLVSRSDPLLQLLDPIWSVLCFIAVNHVLCGSTQALNANLHQFDHLGVKIKLSNSYLRQRRVIFSDILSSQSKYARWRPRLLRPPIKYDRSWLHMGLMQVIVSVNWVSGDWIYIFLHLSRWFNSFQVEKVQCLHHEAPTFLWSKCDVGWT